MIGQTISHYRILNKLGEGGMGVVYAAEDTLLGRRVAIKTLNVDQGKQHYKQRFLREARAASALHHPNIAVIHDYGETPDGKPFIVMELVEGQTLAELLSQGTLKLLRILEIIEEVTKALAEAHRLGVVHRDIKPSNVAINERGQVKVLDFGLAKKLNTDPSINNLESSVLLSTQTREGVIIGTPLYLSPEQALGIPVDARSDLFSLGSLLYECVTGRPAFDDTSDIAICAKVIRDDPPPPSKFNSHVPIELDQIILKLLAKKTESRFQSADELLTELRMVRAAWRNKTERLLPGPVSLFSGLRERARTTLTSALQKPRYLMGAFLLTLIVGFVFWATWQSWKVVSYQPKHDSEQWYVKGTNALRENTYYQASKILEEAIGIDDKFALAHARLAEAWMELGYTDKAQSEISRANALVMNDQLKISQLDGLYLQAINATVERNFNRAAQSYLGIAQKVEDAEKPYIYVDLGRAYEKNGEFEKAIESYQEAAKLDSRYAAAFLHEGILYGRQERFTDAEVALDTASRLYDVQTNPEGLAEVLYQRGILFTSMGDLAKARQELEHALEITHTFSNLSQQIKTQLQLSSVYRLIGDTETAKKYTTQAIDLARSNGLDGLVAQGFIELGTVFFFRSEIKDAESYFREALDLARKDNLRVSEMRALFLLGSLHIQQDEAEEGEAYIQQALPFYEQGEYRNEIMQSQNLLGQAYELKGEYAQSLNAFEQQLQLAKKLNNPLQEGLAHKSIGTVLSHQEKYTEALDHIDLSYSIFSDLGNQLYVGYSLSSRAEVLWRLGDYKKAEADLSHVRALAEQPDGKFKQLWGRIYVVSAPMMLSQRKYSEAVKAAKEVIARDDSNSKHPTIEVKPILGLALYYSGFKDSGRQTCEDAVEMARVSGDPRLLTNSLLSLAQILLETNNAQDAIKAADNAQVILARVGQSDSEWRDWLIMGRANQKLGNNKVAREELSRSDALLSSLQQQWGIERFNTYLARPDVRLYREVLIKASAAVQ
jgi:serine/threonine protein kinase/Flp pilus assembly protein TadD